MHRRIITIIIAALAAAGMAADTADSLLSLRQACFDSFADANPQERVYLHFDNTSYYKGEHIWYSAYVVRDGDFAATPLSHILYVELLNPIGYPVETQKLAISDATLRPDNRQEVAADGCQHSDVVHRRGPCAGPEARLRQQSRQ